MTSLKNDIVDAIDGAMEMPAQYGSRGIWRYRNLKNMVGIVAAPCLFLLLVSEKSGLIADGYIWAGLALIAFTAIALIWRDRVVQRRIDDTGSALSKREPY